MGTQSRYQRERSQLELALEMIAFEARTRTIRCCTGLSDDRIRKLYTVYFKHDERGVSVRRQRGKSPRRVDVFFQSSSKQMEATTLALLMVHYGVFAAGVDGRLRLALPRNSVGFGRRLCRVYALFRTLYPEHSLSFEQAWSLCLALDRGDELALARCLDCDGQFVHDLLSAERSICSCCRLRDCAPKVPEVVPTLDSARESRAL
ncbi:MAG: hypothetical protein AAF610_00985 [Pseudomonadota bacterium]